MTGPWLTEDITSANSARHRQAADDAVTGDPSGHVGAFRALAGVAVASTNVDADKVKIFDAAAELLDARRLEIHRAAGDRTAGMAAFESRQGSWLGPRTDFEHLWVDGEAFVYFAVNAGGRGVPKFGDYCMVVSDPSGDGRSVAVFPGDSAQRYGSTSPIDSGRVRDEAAAWDDRDAIVVSQLGSRAVTVPPTRWPQLICSDDGYLEVVVAPSPPIADVVEVRLRQSHLDRLEELEVRAVAREPLDPTELAEAHAFRSIEGWRATHGTITVGIP